MMARTYLLILLTGVGLQEAEECERLAAAKDTAQSDTYRLLEASKQQLAQYFVSSIVLCLE